MIHQALYTLDTFVHQQITRRRRQGHGTADLVASLVEVRDDETGEAMSETQLRDEIMTLLIAGHTTVAAALAWTWMLVCRHPAIKYPTLKDWHVLSRSIGCTFQGGELGRASTRRVAA